MKLLGILLLAILTLSFGQPLNNSPRIAICITGSRTTPDYEAMDNTIAILEQNGFVVKRFFDPQNRWEDIKRAAVNASILIYDGHGTELGLDGNYGGLVIDDYISAKQIATELKLNLNALVIYSTVCGGAGTSASDENDIGIAEAKKRVLGSGLPFLMAGAGGYFAINQVGGVEEFLQLWFAQKNLSQSFVEVASSWHQIDFNGNFYDQRLPSNCQMGIATQEGGGISTVTSTINGVTTVRQRIAPKSYDVAYLGPANFNFAASLKSQ